LASGVYINRRAAHCLATDAGDKSSRLCCAADANRAALASNTLVSNIDVLIACSKGKTGLKSQGNVVIADTVLEGKGTDGCVAVSTSSDESEIAVGCIVVSERFWASA
jgi:hypothetical protein